MRHLVKGRSLSRSPAHRKALLANLAQELFQRKRIRTTLSKAKELRPLAERLVTIAKKGDLAARRLVAKYVNRRAVLKSLFEEIAPTYTERHGGYTRIVKLGQRVGDNAPLAFIELVGFEGVVAVAATASDSDKAKKPGETHKSKGKSRKGGDDLRAEKRAEKKAAKRSDKVAPHIHRKAPAQKAK